MNRPRLQTPDARGGELTLADQRQMVAALRRALQAQHHGAAVETFETHISFVLVTAEVAYKFKKAVNPGFLDFTTLASRHHDCQEELRLNRRLAPELYLDVVPITGSPSAPMLDGPGAMIDCAVRMRAFPQDGLWDRIAARGALQRSHIDALIELLVAFHRDAAVADVRDRFGTAQQVRATMRGTLTALDGALNGTDHGARLHELRAWEEAAFATLEPGFEERRRDGRVRECHGDLHLGNVTQIGTRTVVFDCIEFNDDFRWIDVMSELAFMAMDLQCHGRADLAHRLVNGYLERSGDYAGARVLRYYVVYRALIRARVATLRASPAASAGGPAAAAAQLRRYLDLALHCSRPAHPALMITHGFSGSGKTTLTQGLLESAGAIRIRADVERKRLFGLDATARSGSPLNTGLYTRDATAATYARLCDLAMPVLAGGYGVVLDATFLRRRQREQARRLATAQCVPFVILEFEADPQTLRERIAQRAARGGDASEADLQVLSNQVRTAEPLGADEQEIAFRCRPRPVARGEIRTDWAPLLARLAASTGQLLQPRTPRPV